MRKPPIRLLTSLTALLLLLAACGDDDAEAEDGTSADEAPDAAVGSDEPAPEEPAEPISASIQLNWVQNAQHFGPSWAAITDVDEAHGLDLDIKPGGGQGIDPIQSVANGQTDFGISSGENVISAYVEGIDIVPIAAVFQKAPTAVTCRADRVTELSQLSTAKVGVRTVSEAQFDTFVAKNDLDKSTMDITPLGGSDVASIIAGVIDCQYTSFATNEPGVMEREGVEPTVFLLSDYGLPQQGDVYFTTAEIAEQEPEKVEAFIAAVTESWQVYLDDPEAAAQWIVDEQLFDGVTFENELSKALAQVPLIEGGPGLLKVDPEVMAMTAATLFEVGTIDTELDVDEFLRFAS